MYRKIHFETPDPLGAGLREEIDEQRENPDATFDLFDRPSAEELGHYLQGMIGEVAVADALQEDYELAT